MQTGHYQKKKLAAAKHNANYKVKRKVKRKNLNPPPRIRAGHGNRQSLKFLGLGAFMSLVLGRFK